ncbi:hypothetical protein EFA46_004195 [Halarchaeum sp. CBA1220]|uniref:hypothetical protein n=1 Tax=Halarchaeum sp. CBA1220 TaxID=1853682 RepID=UPI001313FAB5|nr:hypothetical protein [Halarchaeum sp. CBA1220]QLC33433.1 hypothetical protein EFA46_004195 [Halarchaeum sp. CBA1220]
MPSTAGGETLLAASLTAGVALTAGVVGASRWWVQASLVGAAVLAAHAVASRYRRE